MKRQADDDPLSGGWLQGVGWGVVAPRHLAVGSRRSRERLSRGDTTAREEEPGDNLERDVWR